MPLGPLGQWCSGARNGNYCSGRANIIAAQDALIADIEQYRSINDTRHEQAWIRDDARDGSKVTFTTVRHATSHTILYLGSCNADRLNDAIRINIPPHEPKSYPIPGAPVSITCEIMLNGEDHHVPYARLPNSGSWSNWSLANRLGIRLQWDEKSDTENGRHQEHHPPRDSTSLSRKIRRWIQIPTLAYPLNTVGEISSYILSTSLIHHLLQQHQTCPYPWQPDLGIAHIQKQIFHHTTQTLHLTDFPHPRFRNIPLSLVSPPSQLSREQIDAHLRHLGAWHVGDTFNYLLLARDPRAAGFGFFRRSCDACYLNGLGGDDDCDALDMERITGWARGNPDLAMCANSPPSVSGPLHSSSSLEKKKQEVWSEWDTCSRCTAWGYVCSWTPEEVLEGNQALSAALAIKEFKDVEIEVVEEA